MAASAAELGEAELLDPNPDIHALFMHYNELYFEGRLGDCSVAWSTSRMTLCAGICQYACGGGCAIRLSEPLLKYRSVADLKDTLLHEMIHAYLFLTHGNKEHDDHGPSFQEKMLMINNSDVLDFQKPEQGYHISVYHSFKDEVDKYRAHQWACSVCGDVIKRAMNRVPSAADCRSKTTDAQLCLDPRCSWHMHEKFCCGNYVKVAEPAGYVDKRKRSNEGSKPANGRKRKLQAKVEANNISAPPNVGNRLENFFAIQESQNVGQNVNTDEQDGRLVETDVESNNVQKFMKEVIEITECTGTAPKVDTSHKEESGEGDILESFEFPTGSNTRRSREKQDQNPGLPNVMIGWNGWWAFEEEEDEEFDKLIDRRKQRCKSEKSVGVVQSKILFRDQGQYVNGEPKIETISDLYFCSVHFQNDRRGTLASENLKEHYGDKICHDRHELCLCCVDQNLSSFPVRDSDMMTNVGPSELSTGDCKIIRDCHPENEVVKHVQWKQHTKIADLYVHNVVSSQSDLEAADVPTKDDCSLFKQPTSYQEETCVGQNSTDFCVEQMAETNSYYNISDDPPHCSFDCRINPLEHNSSIWKHFPEQNISGENDAASTEGHLVAEQTESIKKLEGMENLLEGRSHEKLEKCTNDVDIRPKKGSCICCPFCCKIWEGNINDEEFNQEINGHIDVCLSSANKKESFLHS